MVIGNSSYTTTTMLSVLDDVARCVATTSARRLVLLNGHGGNTSLLITACRDIRVAHGLLTFLFTLLASGVWGYKHRRVGMGIHGGLNETSVFSYLRPGEVQMEKLSVVCLNGWQKTIGPNLEAKSNSDGQAGILDLRVL